MTREEAIKILSPNSKSRLVRAVDGFLPSQKVLSALEMAVSAIYAHHTTLDRSRWEGCTHCDDRCCCTCKYSVTRPTFPPCRECGMGLMYDPQNFCPNCGRPLTEVAWAELERRIRGNDGD